jgi:hypothetical protein
MKPKKNRTRTRSAAPLTTLILRDANEAHRILFEDVHGVMSVLKNALWAEDHGDTDEPDIDCIASGYAERACKTVAAHVSKAYGLLEEYDLNFKKTVPEQAAKVMGEIREAIFQLQDLALLAAQALTVESPIHGDLTRYPALTAVTIAARDSYEIADRIDNWMVAQTPKKRAA